MLRAKLFIAVAGVFVGIVTAQQLLLRQNKGKALPEKVDDPINKDQWIIDAFRKTPELYQGLYGAIWRAAMGLPSGASFINTWQMRTLRHYPQIIDHDLLKTEVNPEDSETVWETARQLIAFIEDAGITIWQKLPAENLENYFITEDGSEIDPSRQYELQIPAFLFGETLLEPGIVKTKTEP